MRILNFLEPVRVEKAEPAFPGHAPARNICPRNISLGIPLGFLLLWSTGAIAEAPADLRDLRVAFAKAVAAGDGEAAAQLSSFPLENTEFRGPKTLSKDAFIKRLKSLPAERRKDWADCLKSQTPKKDDKRKDTWAIECDQGNNVYYFLKLNGKWAYHGYENVAE